MWLQWATMGYKGLFRSAILVRKMIDKTSS